MEGHSFRANPNSHPSAFVIGPVLKTLYVILSLFVFICQSGLLLGKCGVSCLFPTIKAASLKLIVFDLQRFSYRRNPRKLLLAVIFPAVKAPNGCNNCINLLGRRRRKPYSMTLSNSCLIKAPWIHEANSTLQFGTGCQTIWPVSWLCHSRLCGL